MRRVKVENVNAYLRDRRNHGRTHYVEIETANLSHQRDLGGTATYQIHNPGEDPLIFCSYSFDLEPEAKLAIDKHLKARQRTEGKIVLGLERISVTGFPSVISVETPTPSS